VAVLVAIGAVLAVPRLRRLAADKVRPKLIDILRDLKALAKTPSRLVELVGGAVVAQLAVALALGASLHAFGEHLSLATLFIVITLASMLGGVSPVPGGMGVVEAGMILGLTAAGIPESQAVAAVFIQRLFTSYLPPIWGWFTLDVLVVCTGNAARSVMAGYMLEHLADAAGTPLRVATAGTHVIDGQPMSGRTRAALASLDGLGEIVPSRHRSRQLEDADLDRADLVVAMETDHVRFIRRRHPAASPRTATLRRLVRDLGPDTATPLADRLADLELAKVELEDWEDVADPAGGDDATYVDCARELWDLSTELVTRL
jgi:protein-tyrosine-phosphatase